MDNDISTNSINPIKKIISKYNFVIFVSLIVAGLIYAILTLTTTLSLLYSDSPSTTTNNTTTSISDEILINKIDKLKTSDQNLADQNLPGGRINPFSE